LLSRVKPAPRPEKSSVCPDADSKIPLQNAVEFQFDVVTVYVAIVTLPQPGCQ